MYPERNILLFYISLTNVSFFSICACNLGISYPRYFPENMRARMYPMNTVVSIALYLVLVVVMDPLHDSKLNQFLMGHTQQSSEHIKMKPSRHLLAICTLSKNTLRPNNFIILRYCICLASLYEDFDYSFVRKII